MAVSRILTGRRFYVDSKEILATNGHIHTEMERVIAGVEQ